MSVDAVLIAGPTAAGKSAAALVLAERLNGVIVNTDAMQVYSELPILSGQPAPDEFARVPHRLYGHVSATERYSAGRFQGEAAAELASILATGRVAIFAGGTGLYFNVLIRGLSPIPQVSTGIRAQVRSRFGAIGREQFHAELVQRDPAAAALRVSDTQRLLRAADVFEATGRPLSHWQAVAGKPVLRGLKLARFVIAPGRQLLAEWINRRFESMIRRGAVDEVRALSSLDSSLPAARMLGFPELSRYLKGEQGLEEAVGEAQMATRRFAKRQLTWFRRYMADWHWLTDAGNNLSSIAGEL
jgi:tRNA dimethylallyltransferase